MSTPTLKRYVAGFLFSPGKHEVVLIRKNKPEWQAGLLNGIGGKIEDNETAIDAMCREFKEETGLVISDWKPFTRLSGNGWTVEFFHASAENYREAQTTTDEKVEIIYVDDLRFMSPISNLLWLIPMALDPLHHDAQVIANN